MQKINNFSEEQVATDILSSRLLKAGVVFLSLIISPFIAKYLGLWEKINPVLAVPILVTGILIFIIMLSKSVENKIIPYFLLQFVPIWVGINQVTFAPMGIDFKIYVAIFGLCSLITFYYIISNFQHLWHNFAFKCLFFFFILNIFYAFLYSSDFRSSNYIDTWIESNMGLKKTLVGAGYGAATREFSSDETKLLKYLIGIVPLVSFVIGYMSLYGLKTLEETNNKFNSLMKMFSVGYAVNLIVLIFAMAAGTASVVFMDNRLRINDNFTGVDFEGLFLLLSIGFYLYIANFRPAGLPAWLKQLITFNIIILSLLILLGIKKGTILSFLAGFMIIQFCSAFYKNKHIKASPKLFNKNIQMLLVLLIIPPIFTILPALFFNQDFISGTVYNISNRFSTTDTLDVRTTNWHYYIENWLNNLTWLKAIFGFGTDSSREITFFLTAMQPDKGYQQPHIHNIYLEYFYNWGLMALLYFLPAIIVLIKDIYRILSKTATKAVKLFSSVSMALVVFFLLFYTAESPSMISHITFFAFLGFVESLKIAFTKHDPTIAAETNLEDYVLDLS